MSKDKELTPKEAVETVDKILDYCISTLEFWGYGKNWPTNLISDSLTECKKILKFVVSRSHINDK